jgi:hypothetical protein
MSKTTAPEQHVVRGRVVTVASDGTVTRDADGRILGKVVTRGEHARATFADAADRKTNLALRRGRQNRSRDYRTVRTALMALIVAAEKAEQVVA